MAIILNAKTDIEWINQAVSIPILGEGLVAVVIFVPAMILSFIMRTIIPSLTNDNVIWFLLPGWTLFLWMRRIRLYLLLVPAWALLTLIAIVHAITLITTAYNGQ